LGRELSSESLWRRHAATLVAALALLILIPASLIAGHVWLTPTTPDLARLIIFELRLPRAVLAVLVGSALGLAGAVLQGLTRNPLAEPGLLGISAGASLGAVIAIYFGFALISPAVTPVAGLLGALGAMSLTFALGRGGSTIALILAGSAVSALAAACISLALNLAPSPYAAYEIMTWLMGSLTDRSWDQVELGGPFILAGCAMLAFTGRSLDLLSLGELQAQSLGLHPERLQVLALVGTALAVGAATSIVGAIGFVGLVAPHLVRPFVGHQPSRILLPSALVGAAILLGSDICVRLVHVGPELKIGVLTSLLGTPFFFWLVLQLRKTSP
jgi:iron complex transport system permease protein